ncbi:integrase [Acinetobacter baumannii]|uniref:integrase n=1 Tax=Acinetobacter baumannii TaxID=470 RepID=UPI00396C5BCD
MTVNSEYDIKAQAYPKNIKGLVERAQNYSNRTALRYTNVWNKLLIKYGEKDNIVNNPEAAINNVVNNLIAEYSNNEYRDSTFRQYRAAVIYRLSVILLEQGRTGNKILSLPKAARFFESLKNVERINTDQKQPKRSSSSKLKYFPKDLYEHVGKTQNEVIGSKLGVMLKCFLEANMLLGLRPVEWLSLRLACDVEKKCLCLVVDNGKHSNGRANGEIRILDLLEDDREKLKSQLRIILGFKKLLDKELENKARKILNQLSADTGEQYKLYISSREPDEFLYEYFGVNSQRATINEDPNNGVPINGTKTTNGINGSEAHGDNLSGDSINGDPINGIKTKDGIRGLGAHGDILNRYSDNGETINGINTGDGITGDAANHGAQNRTIGDAAINSARRSESHGVTANGTDTINGINSANGIIPVGGSNTESGRKSHGEDDLGDTDNGINPDNGKNPVDGSNGQVDSQQSDKTFSRSETISQSKTFSRLETFSQNEIISPELKQLDTAHDDSVNTVSGENTVDSMDSENGNNAVLFKALNTAVIESYVDKHGAIQYALCQAYMDSLQSKLYRICNEFYKNKKLGLVEEIEVNKANATIYSSRHQAVANRKKAKWKLDEIAAWFGHASIETASRHYGRAGRAWGELPYYRPSRSSIELVRVREAVMEQSKTPMSNQELINQVVSEDYLDGLL